MGNHASSEDAPDESGVITAVPKATVPESVAFNEPDFQHDQPAAAQIKTQDVHAARTASDPGPLDPETTILQTFSPGSPQLRQDTETYVLSNWPRIVDLFEQTIDARSRVSALQIQDENAKRFAQRLRTEAESAVRAYRDLSRELRSTDKTEGQTRLWIKMDHAWEEAERAMDTLTVTEKRIKDTEDELIRLCYEVQRMDEELLSLLNVRRNSKGFYEALQRMAIENTSSYQRSEGSWVSSVPPPIEPLLSTYLDRLADVRLHEQQLNNLNYDHEHERARRRMRRLTNKPLDTSDDLVLNQYFRDFYVIDTNLRNARKDVQRLRKECEQCDITIPAADSLEPMQASEGPETVSNDITDLSTAQFKHSKRFTDFYFARFGDMIQVEGWKKYPSLHTISRVAGEPIKGRERILLWLHDSNSMKSAQLERLHSQTKSQQSLKRKPTLESITSTDDSILGHSLSYQPSPSRASPSHARVGQLATESVKFPIARRWSSSSMFFRRMSKDVTSCETLSVDTL